jgi:hypothetical protein
MPRPEPKAAEGRKLVPTAQAFRMAATTHRPLSLDSSAMRRRSPRRSPVIMKPLTSVRGLWPRSFQVRPFRADGLREKPSIKHDRRLRPHINPRCVRVIGINHDILVVPSGHHGRDNEQGRPPAGEPRAAKSLRNRTIIQIIPAGRQARIKPLAGHIVRNNGLDEARRARRRFSVRVYENLEQRDGETRSSIDRRQSRRIPSLSKKARAFARPDRMNVRDDAPQSKRHGLKARARIRERGEFPRPGERQDQSSPREAD